MELIQNIKGQLIGQIKSSGIKRITKENLVNLINGFKIWTQDNRELSDKEKDELFIELSSHYVADLNYDTDYSLLMLVIEEIESRGFPIHCINNLVIIKENNTISAKSMVSIMGTEKTKKAALYKAALNFIKNHENN